MFSIRLIRSRRRTLALEIGRDGVLIIRAPLFMPEAQVMDFVRKKEGWIRSSMEAQSRLPRQAVISQEMREQWRLLAKERIPPRVSYWSQLTGLSYSSLKITAAEKRFGSCSAKNGLCFSLYLVNYPAELLDYVIVHELCHTKEHNHSSAFYALVESILPDWKEREVRLRSLPIPGVMQNS